MSADNIIASKTNIITESVCPLTTSNVEVVKSSDIVIIAVKPAVVGTVLAELSTNFTPDELRSKTFISIAAGISISDLESKLGVTEVSFIRVMPNTPCCVGQCAAAYSPGFYATPKHKLACEAIFKSVGIISQVPEYMMDGVTGLSGSGPACKNHKFDSNKMIIHYGPSYVSDISKVLNVLLHFTIFFITYSLVRCVLVHRGSS